MVVDGGLATELEAPGHDLSDRLWSARLLLSEPDAIEAVHLAYYRAGAQVATTASYQAIDRGLRGGRARAGERASTRSRRSVELAQRARDRYREETGDRPTACSWRARSARTARCSPMGRSTAATTTRAPSCCATSTARGSRPSLEAGVDLLAFETIPTIREAEVLVDLLDDVGAPAWLSYSCRDGRSTSAGRADRGRRRASAPHPRIVAVGVNCTAPRHSRPSWPRREPRRTCRSSPTRTAASAGTPRAGAGSPTTAVATTPPWSRHGPSSGPPGSAAAAGPDRPTSPPWPGRSERPEHEKRMRRLAHPRCYPRARVRRRRSSDARRAGSRPG